MRKANIKPEERRIIFIKNQIAFERAIEEIREHKVIAVDLETDSRYAYEEKVCLVQIGTPKKLFIFDTLRINNIQLMKELLEDSGIEKIFHDIRYDFEMLKNKLQIFPRNIFDTLVAGYFTEYGHKGLQYYLEEFFQKEVNKELNISDWSKRPIPQEWIEYAADDVRYLIELRAMLIQNAESLEEMKEYFQLLEDFEVPEKVYNPDHFIALPRTNTLSPIQLRVLKELYIWREEEAKRRNRLVQWILVDEKLVQLAETEVSVTEDVKKLIGKDSVPADKYGDQIFEVIKKASTMDPLDSKTITYRKRFIELKEEEGEEEEVNKDYYSEKSIVRKRALFELRNILKKETGRKHLDMIFIGEYSREISILNPSSMEELPIRKGFGPWYISKYGQRLLDTLQQTNREFRCLICEKELHDSTVASKCPYCVSKYHMNCINEYLSENNTCQNCGKEITVK